MKACFGFTAPIGSVNLQDRNAQESLLKSVFQDIHWEVPKLLEMMSQASDFYFDAAAQVDMEKWYQRRVILLMDYFIISPWIASLSLAMTSSVAYTGNG